METPVLIFDHAAKTVTAIKLGAGRDLPASPGAQTAASGRPKK